MEISELKSRLDIVQVASSLGISIGRNNRAICPFHDDKNPSLQFSKDKQICTCFSGKCNAGTMDVIGLTEKKLNLSTGEAIKYLKQYKGIPTNEQPKPKPKPMQDRTAILQKAFTHFTSSLAASSPAQQYLESRNLDYQLLNVGYHNGTLHYGPNKGLIPELEQAGLLRKTNSGYASFALASIVFPLRNKKNEITSMYFRAVEPRPGKFKNYQYEKHMYLKDMAGLYPKYPSPETKKIIIVESIIDTATLQQIPEITAEYELLSSYGTNGIREEHSEALSQLKELEEIILWFDGDQAGSNATAKTADELLTVNDKWLISFVETPEGEDINSLSIGHQPELFTELLNKRKPFVPQKEEKEEKKQKEAEKPKAVEANTHQLTSSPTHKSTNSPTPQLTNSKTHQLTNSPAHQLTTSNPHKISYTTTVATYYVKGGIPKALDSMKVTLEIEQSGAPTGNYKKKSRTKVDLYEDRQVEKISREAGEKLGIRADLIEQDLNYLTDLLDEHREQTISADTPNKPEKPVITMEQQQKCITFLKRTQLLHEFNKLIEQAGITGEENNRIFLFVIATAYKMPDTLHALIQGSSGSGKTYLSKQITDLMPKEDVIRLTRVTESSFYNFGEYEIQYKLIVLEDVDGLKEEAEYAFRELQSNGEISSGLSVKNENSGTFNTIRKIVKGPIGSIATTTKGEIYEDNMSRVFVLAVDESKEQTNRIINYLNHKSSGMINKTKETETKHFIQNCIRLLKPHEVINPYANKILLPPEAHKIRRLTELFHAFVNQVTLINQYQRTKDQHGRLITEKEDVETAIEIMFESIVLKVDELDGSLRQFYEDLKGYVMSKGEAYKEYQFTQIEIRQALNIKKTRLSYYLNELQELEYISQSGYSNRGFRYKIAYWDNLEAMRNRIKTYLQDQLEKL